MPGKGEKEHHIFTIVRNNPLYCRFQREDLDRRYILCYIIKISGRGADCNEYHRQRLVDRPSVGKVSAAEMAAGSIPAVVGPP